MTQDEAIQLFRGGRAGIDEWNRRRKQREEPPDLSGVDLSGQDLRGADLVGVRLTSANLAGTTLSGVELTGADLIFASLARADLRHANLARAHLVGADLNEANLSGADLSSSQLIKARLDRANCSQASFQRADLSQTTLLNADCTSADFSHALLADADLNGTILRSANLEHAAVIGVRYRRRGLTCRGIRVDSCHGHAVFKRDAQDQDWIETFRAQSRRHYLLYLFWMITTDCGRSLSRAAIAAAVLSLGFGSIYANCPSLLNTARAVNSGWTPYYYSIVTFTTLGFGDVTPGSLLGELVVTLEVAMGYVTLGILVSILANKVARRS